MTHAGAATIATEHPALPNQPFYAWLRTQTALFVGQISALLGAAYLILALVYYVNGAAHVPAGIISGQTIERAVIYAHLLFLTVFIGWLIGVMEDNTHGTYRATQVYRRLVESKFAVDNLTEREAPEFAEHCAEQVRTFKLWFLGFWCAMLFLYMVFAIQPKFDELYTPPVHDSAVTWPTLLFPFLKFMANNLSMFFIFCCFVVLYIPAGTGINRHFTAEAAEHRRRQRKIRWRFGVVLALFTLAFPGILLVSSVPLTTDNWTSYVAVFDALSGVLNAVVVALMIARLDSKLIGLPPWLISILYFYSGVQPLFVVFERPVDEFSAIRTSVLLVVFMFKLYFFLIIVYSLQNGRLLNYFYSSPLVNQYVAAKWKDRISLHQQANNAHVDQPPSNANRLALRRRLAKSFSDSRRFFLRPKPEWPLRLGKLLGWIGIIYFVTSLLYFAGTVGANGDASVISSKLQTFAIYAHLPLLVIVIAVVYFTSRSRASAAGGVGNARPPSRSVRQFEKLKHVDNRMRQFQRFFLLFWCVMLAFYISLAVRQHWISPMVAALPPEYLKTSEPPSSHADTDAHAPAHPASTGHEEPTPEASKPAPAVSESKPPDPAIQAQVRRYSTWSMGFSILSFALNNLMVLFIFLCFSVLYLSVEDRHVAEKYTSLRNYSILGCILLTTVIPLLLVSVDRGTMTIRNPVVATTVMAAVGGTLNAVAFALLIARLDSRLIRLPSSVISVLYAYSALQPLFVVFERGVPVFHAIETSALLTAFIFKICLLLIIFHALESGRLQDHLVAFPMLNSRVNSIFDNQFEIRAHGTEKRFKYAIFKADKEMYTTEEYYATRTDCDNAVARLIKLMQEYGNYDKPAPVQGTYWIEVRDATNGNAKVICESKDLRSEDEVEDLIKECIEMVPYCKYSRER